MDLKSLDWQEDEKGRFRQIGLRVNGQVPKKWINGGWKYNWIYLFKREDNTTFEIEIGYKDEIFND